MASRPKDKPKQYEMKQRRLANADLSALRVPTGMKSLEVRDTSCDGLRLRVTPTGKKTWSVVYRVAGVGGPTEAGMLPLFPSGVQQPQQYRDQSSAVHFPMVPSYR
ncbi:hypothetical protein [Parasphingorhabdus sp.]|uniref:hypothetical protein n=1 Tax=Parasphingorhabdus sp. TaxID=2709688 RepID=UPI0030026E8B